MKQEKLTINFASCVNSTVQIGRDILADHCTWSFLSDTTQLAAITNPTVWKFYGEQLQSALPIQADVFKVEDGEKYKTLESHSALIDKLILHQYKRNSTIIALGGGVIGDLAGFVAATYLRGVRLIQVPTTLLAQVDSSVGGKTAVNHVRGKNLIGAFHQPEFVVIDTQTLESLPQRVYVEGLAEVVKYGIIDDVEFLCWLERNVESLLAREQSALVHAVTRSCQIKAKIVELDEMESSTRMLLNFGHTYGHGIENAAGYGEILHGEAVAIGMALELELAARLGICTRQTADRVERLLQSLCLPTRLPQGIDIEQIENAMGHDKKATDTRLRFVIARELGDTFVQYISDSGLIRAILEEAS